MLPESESGGDFSLDLVTDGFNLCKQIGDTLKLREAIHSKLSWKVLFYSTSTLGHFLCPWLQCTWGVTLISSKQHKMLVMFLFFSVKCNYESPTKRASKKKQTKNKQKKTFVEPRRLTLKVPWGHTTAHGILDCCMHSSFSKLIQSCQKWQYWYQRLVKHWTLEPVIISWSSDHQVEPHWR